MTTVAIVSPGYPDAPGGVTDHTRRLVCHWSEAGHSVQVLGTRRADPDTVVREWAAVGVSGVLIQYVPFLYGRRGVSLFPERIARAAHGAGIRVVTFVHEPWVPPTRLSWLALSPIQRFQLRRLLAVSDASATPVPAWRKLLGGTPKLIYVGSTLGDIPPGVDAKPRLDAPVVFSPFAAGLCWDWITAAAEAIGAGLTVLGADRDAVSRHPSAGRWIGPSWDFRGRLPAAQALRLLAGARLVLAPFVDGLTGRRTSAMAALSVGARTVSSGGPLFDSFFDGGPAAIAGTRDEFVKMATHVWSTPDTGEARAERVSWHRTHLDPRALDARLFNAVSGLQ
jgi:hypothetical protein